MTRSPTIPARCPAARPAAPAASGTPRPEQSRSLGAARAIALASALVTGACGDTGPLDASLPAATTGDAVWEREFAPEECTGTISARILHPVRLADGGNALDPVPGAEVRLLAPRPDGRLPLRLLATKVTAEDGSYSFDGVPPVFALEASKQGLAPSIGGTGLRHPGAVTFVAGENPLLGLQSAATFRVQVRDARGPVKGANVEVVSLAFREALTTGDDGTFSATGPVGRVSVVVSDPRYDVVRQVIDTTVPPNEVVVVTTAPVEPYSGTVRTAEDDRPIAGAVVIALDEPSARTTTAADGTFRLPVPRAGRMGVFAAGREWHTYDIARASAQEVRLRRCAGVRGRVLSESGLPVAEARIVGVTENSDGGFERVPGPLTAADGSFDFSWMPPPPRWASRPVVVVAWHRRAGISAPASLPSAGPIEFRLSGWRELRGRVRGPGGQPLGGVHVTADWTSETMDEFVAGVMELPWQHVVSTEADGTFRLASVPDSLPVRLEADVLGLRLQEHVPAGGFSDVTFDVPPGLPMTGRVVTSANAPVAGAVVVANLLDTPGIEIRRSVLSDEQGRWQFDDLPAGRYSVTAEAPGMDLPGGGEGRPGGPGTDLVVEKSATLDVTVEYEGLAAGDPRPDVTLRIEDLLAPSLPARPVTLPRDGSDRVKVTRIRPGRSLLRAEGEDWRGRIDRLEVPDGAVVPVRLRVSRTLRFRGTLRDPAGAPLSGEQVVVSPVAGTAGLVQTLWSADGGEVSGAGFGPGTWEVRVAPRDHAPLTVRVTIPQDVPAELSLPPCGTLIATVREADGRPRADAILSLSGTDGSSVYGWADEGKQLVSRFRTDREGIVRVRGIPAGPVRVLLAGGGSRKPESKDVEIPSGGTARIVWE